MAKVSLRIYNREIENLIDQGNINEAIAHCHHILKTFPKHLETYRLLGKAYLESKRYAEAKDIFSRVLMAVPDDYVSHVGMSIIHDDERKMDEAIWHMERAFETQSSNAAIQGELQRLYGRRDGIELPRIRMTRGALSHLYVQGELYPQAIAEIRAVLADEPDRADMQVLLARAYFRGGQKADASDLCAQLLKRYQYCFDANRIMVDLLPATATATESTQVYRMRVGEMDPYATFAKGSVFLANEVPDASISLDKLEYKGEEEPAGQAWSPSLGLGAGMAAAPALAAAITPDQSAADVSPQTAAPAEEIPDFLRQAGWGTLSGPEQPTSMFDEEPAGEELAPAEIPDWLKAQEPVNAAPTPPPQPEPGPAQEIEVPDWLLESQTSESMPAEEIPDWLKVASEAPVEPAQMDETSAWLNGLESAQSSPESTTTEIVDDWLSKLEEKQVPAAEPAQEANISEWLGGLEDSQAVEPAQEANIPDWLSGLEDRQVPAVEPEKEANIPDWLSGLEDKQAAEPVVETEDKQAVEPANLPDWLSGLEPREEQQPAQPVSTVESLGSTAQEQDDAIAWLESLAAKHGAKPEELVTDPSRRSEKPPEWVSQAQSLGQEAPAPQPAAPAPKASVESLGTTAQEQDDAIAWLESLAAKHGAKPEELVTEPSKRSEKPPEWVSQAQSIGESQPVEPEKKPEVVEEALNVGEQWFAEFESTFTESPVKDETSAWLENLTEEEQQEEKQAESVEVSTEIPDWLSASQPEDEIPEWLSDAQPPQDSGGQFEFAQKEFYTQKSDLPNWLGEAEEELASQPVPGGQDIPESDLANWLNSLDDEPGLPFDSIPTPDSILFDSQRPALQSSGKKPDLPDWLSESDSQSVEAEEEWEEIPVKQDEGLPSWLQETDEEATSVYDEEDMPPWQLREKWEAEEPQYPMPTSHSDWHPMEEKPAPRMEAQKAFVPPPPEPVTTAPFVTAPAPQPAAPAKKKLGLPAHKKKPESANVATILQLAKNELDRGDIPAALSHYGKLIKRGKHIEETIRDLTESLYRYPVEVGIWQALGDAYMRVNRLKEALESYNKAEELIR